MPIPRSFLLWICGQIVEKGGKADCTPDKGEATPKSF